VLASQIFPLGSQHIRFHDALLGGHEGHRISEEVHHETNRIAFWGTPHRFFPLEGWEMSFPADLAAIRQSKRFRAGQENKGLLDWLRSL